MAVTSGFFNSINHDRLYDAIQMSSMFDGIINDGVLDSYGGKLLTTSAGGLSVTVASGKAWFRHTWTLNDQSIIFTLENADPFLSRIDCIYLEVNNGTRVNKIAVKKGDNSESGSDPVKPELESSETMKQYPLAYITIEAGTTEITDSVIENAVGTEACPFSNGLMEQVTTTQLFNQWGSQFLDWWNDVKELLDGDPTTEFQNEIDELRQWTVKFTIPAQSETYTINDAYFKTTSIIDIYYNDASVEEVSRRNPKYTLGTGTLTIRFDNKTSKEIIIDGIHVHTPHYRI